MLLEAIFYYLTDPVEFFKTCEKFFNQMNSGTNYEE